MTPGCNIGPPSSAGETPYRFASTRELDNNACPIFSLISRGTGLFDAIWIWSNDQLPARIVMLRVALTGDNTR